MSSSKPQVHALVSANGCQSYRPGHQVHWIQARVKRDEPRFDAKVEIVDDTTVRIRWLDQARRLRNHLSSRIKAALELNPTEYVKYSPTSKLLYIQSELPNGLHGGTFSLFYLSEEELSPCQFQQKVVSILDPRSSIESE